ncbi:MAG: phosphogluconate dehydrogenase [Gammaproteobacteria bacterium]|nr:phosphogluconate dehydrogenase [Gammaproteobacteria bacterium]
MTVVGIITPGAMGASVAAAAKSNGHDVIWAGAGRSQDTVERAARAGLRDVGDHAELVREAAVILSVCPPHLAESLGSEVADLGFTGLFVEGNAVTPERTLRIAAKLAEAGAETVDGGIIGGPAWEHGAGTRFYLAGLRAEEVSALFRGSPLEAPVLDGDPGAASGLKMTFAAFTKGSTALLTAILAAAENLGVRADLERQWGESFTDQTRARVTANTAKAWRFAGEMREIAATFEGAGLPGGFHAAAADVFERLAGFKDAPQPGIDAVLEVLKRR